MPFESRFRQDRLDDADRARLDAYLGMKKQTAYETNAMMGLAMAADSRRSQAASLKAAEQRERKVKAKAKKAGKAQGSDHKDDDFRSILGVG
jgi:hypothetical protein